MDLGRIACGTAMLGGDIATRLAAIRAAGFASIELLGRDLFAEADGPDVVIDALRRHGLSVSAFQALRNFEGADEALRPRKRAIAESIMSLMHLADVELLVLCSNLDPSARSDVGRLAEDLRWLGDLAKRHGIRIAYEALSWAPHIFDYREAARLVSMVDHPNVGLVLDTVHIFALDLPLSGLDAVPAEKIFLVELADLPGLRVPPLEASRHYRLFPGEGTAPLGEFIGRLEHIGYAGPCALEIFNTHYLTLTPEEVAARARRAVDRLLPR